MMHWEKVSGASEPKRWAKACGLVQLYVQDHPLETVRGMRYTWEARVNGASILSGNSHSERHAKTAASRATKRVLVSALQHLVGNDTRKWTVK